MLGTTSHWNAVYVQGVCLPCVELELGGKKGAVEVDLCFEGEGVGTHPLRLHLRSSQQHKPKRTQGDRQDGFEKIDQRVF